MLNITHLLRVVPETHEAEIHKARPPSNPRNRFLQHLAQYLRTFKALQNCEQLVSKTSLRAFMTHVGCQHDTDFIAVSYCVQKNVTSLIGK